MSTHKTKIFRSLLLKLVIDNIFVERSGLRRSVYLRGSVTWTLKIMMHYGPKVKLDLPQKFYIPSTIETQKKIMYFLPELKMALS